LRGRGSLSSAKKVRSARKWPHHWKGPQATHFTNGSSRKREDSCHVTVLHDCPIWADGAAQKGIQGGEKKAASSNHRWIAEGKEGRPAIERRAMRLLPECIAMLNSASNLRHGWASKRRASGGKEKRAATRSESKVHAHPVIQQTRR